MSANAALQVVDDSVQLKFLQVRCVGRSPGASVRVGSSFWFSAQSFQRFPESTRYQRLEVILLSRIMS